MAAGIAAALWLVSLLLEPTSAVLSWPGSLRVFLIIAALAVLFWLTALPVRFLAQKLRFNKKKRILTVICMLAYYLIELTVFFAIVCSQI